MGKLENKDEWIYKVDWKQTIQLFLDDKKAREQIDNDLKNGQVFNAPHKDHENIELCWPYLIDKTSYIDVTAKVKIGPYFMMNSHSVILSHSHPIFSNLPMMMQCLAKTEPSILEIGRDVWLQRGTTVMPSVCNIHNGTLLVVGSILTKDTTCENGIWAGTPAKLIKMRPELQAAIPNSGERT